MPILLPKIIASVFFIGYIPYGSGTWCSLLCAIILFAFAPSVLLLSLMIIMSLIIGTWASYQGEKIWGKDSAKIVIDEFAGMLITMFLIPLDVISLSLGFILFRFYDILKPFPIKNIERKIQNGLGVMLDDVLAGIMANITLRIIVFIV